ncbi:pilin [Pseudonocardia adelaidensis]|uniref:TrbC/VIRB2 family protein n=1 Tax=Pseudonocardia adelaidensis TaxID=648754 RepID=A0ABP9P6V3_9PSEU
MPTTPANPTPTPTAGDTPTTGLTPAITRPAGQPPNPRARTAPSPTLARSRSRIPAFALAALLVVALLFAASAPAAAHEGGAGMVLAQAQSVDQVLTNIRNWLMGILAGLATVMATIGGIRYTMADGDPGEVQRAKTAFRNAGIGFALAALAPLLVTVLQGVVGL